MQFLTVLGTKIKNKNKIGIKLVTWKKRKVKRLKLTKRTKMNQWPK
jgi:predicted ATPase